MFPHTNAKPRWNMLVTFVLSFLFALCCMAQDISLGTVTNPIKFGVPYSLSDENIGTIQRYLNNYQYTGLYINAVRTKDPVGDLQSVNIHLNLVDASQGYLAWKRFSHQVLITEGITGGLTAYESYILKKNPTPGTDTTYAFSSLSAGSVCASSFHGSDMLAAYAYGSSTGAFTPATAVDPRIDSCSSTVTASMRAFLPDACAPPTTPDAPALCSACGVGSLAGTSVDAQAECEAALGGGYARALQRLFSGVCQTALLRNTTYHNACVAPLLQASSPLSLRGTTTSTRVPAWCPAEGPAALAYVSASTARGLGVLPSRVFMVRQGLLSSDMARSLFYALMGVGAVEELCTLLDIEGVALPLSTRSSLGVVENWATDACSLAHFQQGGFDALMAALPGTTDYVTCAGCTNGAALCLRGTKTHPLRVVLPLPHAQVATSAAVTEWVSYVSSPDNMAVPVHVSAVGREYATVSALARRAADVAPLSATQAWVGHYKYGFPLVAVEQESNNATGTPTLANTYEPVVYARGSNATALSLLSQVKGKRVCTGGLLDSDATALVAFGLSNPAQSGMTYSPSTNVLTTSAGQSMYSCRSPLLDIFQQFLSPQSCAPALTQGQVGQCTSCPAACSNLSPYFTAEGALRGLAEGVCDYAIARANTLDNACLTGATAPGVTPSSWCSTTTGATVQRSIVRLGTVPTDAFVAYSPVLSADTLAALPAVIATLYTNEHFRATLLPLYGYRALTATATTSAAAVAHLAPYSATAAALPGLSVAVALADQPLPDAFPSCSSALTTGKGSAADPVLIALPPGSLPMAATMFAAYRQTVLTLTGLHVAPVQLTSPSYPSLATDTATDTATATTTATNALNAGRVDVALVDSAEAYLAALRYGHRVVAMQNNTLRGTTGYQAAPTVLGLRSAMTVDGVFTRWSFASLRGKRVCVGDPNSALAWAVAGWATPNVPSFATYPALVAPDQCAASLMYSFANYFGTMCAPPAVHGAVGDCTACPAAGASCGGDSPYHGPGGALRGLFEGVCDVAITSTDAYDTYCSFETTIDASGNAVVARAAWCGEQTALEPVAEAVAGGWAGLVPNRAWTVLPEALPDALLGQVARALLALNSHEELLALFSPMPFAMLTTDGNPLSSALVAPGSITANTVFKGLFTAPIASVPGLTLYSDCAATASVACTAAVPSNCANKGEQPFAPLLFALPTSAWSDQAYKLFSDFFALRAVHATAPVLIKPLRLSSPSSQHTLASRAADIAVVDSFSGYLGWRRHGQRVVLQENTQLSDAGSYRLTAWVHGSSPYRTFSSLRGLRACVGGFETSTRVGTLAFALNHWKYTLINSTALDTASSMGLCPSVASQTLSTYFPRSCAPAADGTPAATLACPAHPQLYHGHLGALRGLAEGLCDVAFARESSYIDACTAVAPREWCAGFTPRALTSVDDTAISATEGLGLYPGDAVMVRANDATETVLLRAQEALITMAANATLQQYLPFARGLKAPIQGQSATEAATALALGGMTASLTVVPGLDAFVTPTAAYETCPVSYTAADTATLSATSALPPTGAVAVQPQPAPQSAALRVAVPMPTPAHRDLWTAQLAALAQRNVSVELTDAASPSALRGGLADVVWVDAFSAALAHVRYGHQVLAVGGYYNNPTHTTSSTATGAKDVISATYSTQTTASVLVLDPDYTQLGPATHAELRGLRMCAANFAFASAAAAHTPAWASLLASTDTATAMDACTAPALASLAAFTGPSCAPPFAPTEAGLCDLCSASGLQFPLSVASVGANDTIASAVCGPSNAFAQDIGAMTGLAARACQFALVPSTLYPRACTGTHPLTSALADAPNAFQSSLAVPACASPAPLTTLPLPASNPFPSHVFLVRNDTLDSSLLAALYRVLTTDLPPALLAVLGVDAVTHARAGGAAVTATYARTPVATGAYEWAFTLTDAAGTLPADVATDAYTRAHLQAAMTSMSLQVPGFAQQVTCQPAVRAALATDGVLTDTSCSLMPSRGCNNYFATERHLTLSPNSAITLQTSAAFLVAAVVAFVLAMP